MNNLSYTFDSPVAASTLEISEFVALLPVIALAVTVVVVMLLAAFLRSHKNTAVATAFGLILTLGTIPFAAQETPQSVTPLLIIDTMTLYMSTLLICISLAITLFAYPYFAKRNIHREAFYILLLLALLGAITLTASNHFATLIIGLELLGIPVFCLTAYCTADTVTGQRSLEAGIKYLVLSAVATALILFGIALLYAFSGQLSFVSLMQSFPQNNSTQTEMVLFYAGSILIFSGMCFKLSIVPFHLWTPDVYQGAPAPVSAIIATLSKGAVFTVFLRYMIASNSLYLTELFNVVIIVAALSMLAGNWLALMQENIKRLLAYSSIAHLGYLLVAFLALQGNSLSLAIEACSIYLVAYMMTTTAAFALVSLLSSQQDDEMDCVFEYRGLFWRHPTLGLLFTFILLSLAGIPLTAGFIGKFYVLTAGTSAELWTLLILFITGSGIGLFYYLRLITVIFSQPATSTLSTQEASVFFRSGAMMPGFVTIAILSAAVFWMGIFPQPLITQAQKVAAAFSIPSNYADGSHAAAKPERVITERGPHKKLSIDTDSAAAKTGTPALHSP